MRLAIYSLSRIEPLHAQVDRLTIRCQRVVRTRRCPRWDEAALHPKIWETGRNFIIRFLLIIGKAQCTIKCVCWSVTWYSVVTPDGKPPTHPIILETS